MTPNCPYAPPAGFDFQEPPVTRLWPGGLFLIPMMVSLVNPEWPVGLGWIKTVFPLLLFAALVVRREAFWIQGVLIIARMFAIGLAVVFLWRGRLDVAGWNHATWVVCFLTGSFLACHPSGRGHGKPMVAILRG